MKLVMIDETGSIYDEIEDFHAIVKKGQIFQYRKGTEVLIVVAMDSGVIVIDQDNSTYQKIRVEETISSKDW